MVFTQRTHTCGALRASHVGETVTLNGWVHGRRDLGGMIFIDVRDRYGITQVVFTSDANEQLREEAKELRSEFVISVTGIVRNRPDGMVNPAMPTGEIEVASTNLEILNRAEVPPFEVRDEIDAFEDLRLKYRYLDLRRPILQRNLLLRHKLYQIVHRYFDGRQFVEIETPVLMKSTPEGARDYLVPSRVHPGKFYALPQSPQTYKQLLMVAGLDRYVQIVKCFRDEDLRADRQPEFTQIDLEMSFVTREDVFNVIEGFMQSVLQELEGFALRTPLPRMDYFEALERYGSDKPDLRFGMELHTLNVAFVNGGFKVFADVAQRGGAISGFVVEGGASLSRKQLDELSERAKELGLGGLAWMKFSEGDVQSPIAKFLSPEIFQQLRMTTGAGDGDAMLIGAGMDKRSVWTAMGTLRVEVARARGLVDPAKHALLWVVDFPLFQYDEKEGRYFAEHHPFTGPKAEDIPKLDTNPSDVRSDCYDLVWNGNEIGSGSIRIHDSALQSKIFSILGLSEEEIKEKFGFLIDAFRYGAPPHGGIALGLDRIVAILCGISSIREVMAFPKTTSASSLMDNSPSPVSDAQLDELHLKVVK